jgi:hypothetical protein
LSEKEAIFVKFCQRFKKLQLTSQINMFSFAQSANFKPLLLSTKFISKLTHLSVNAFVGVFCSQIKSVRIASVVTLVPFCEHHVLLFSSSTYPLDQYIDAASFNLPRRMTCFTVRTNFLFSLLAFYPISVILAPKPLYRLIGQVHF